MSSTSYGGTTNYGYTSTADLKPKHKLMPKVAIGDGISAEVIDQQLMFRYTYGSSFGDSGKTIKEEIQNNLYVFTNTGIT